MGVDFLQSRTSIPTWGDARYARLHFLDRVQDGQLYDCLVHEFHDEQASDNTYIPIHERKPSVQYNVPRKLSKNIARKLFAGRHKPHLIHDDNNLVTAVTGLCAEGQLDMKMLKAVFWGQVGSVAVTFKFMKDTNGSRRIVYDVWRGKWCIPTLDPLGELIQLRVRYPVSGRQLNQMDPKLYGSDNKNKPIEPSTWYFFVRDFTAGQEITYAPIRVEEHDVTDSELAQREVIDHNFDFVPGVWMPSGVPGGYPPDGGCVWEESLPLMVDYDYTMSQTGRGIRYNVAPQLVLKGALKNISYNPSNGQMTVIERDPNNAIHLAEDTKDADGTTHSGGDAKLLETNGQGLKVAVESYGAVLRKDMLELIGGSRKDPDKLAALQSGKAMELLDEEEVDTVAEARTAFGEYGYLPLLRKSARAARAIRHELFDGVSVSQIDALTAQWPRMYQPSAQEFLQFVQGLQALRSGETPGSPTGTSEGAKGPGQGLKPLISDDEARALLEVFIDIPSAVKPQAQQQRPTQVTGHTPVAENEGGEETQEEGGDE